MMGRLLAIAILHGECLPLRLKFPFLKQLLNRPLELEDLELVDADLYNNKIKPILAYSQEELAACDLYFVDEETALGHTKETELVDCGSVLQVRTANRKEYVNLLCNHLLTANIKEQTEAVRKGVLNVIPEVLWNAMSRCLSAEDLDEIIAGKEALDLGDWQEHTIYEAGYTAESEQVVWFWELLRGWDSAQQAQLLRFVTGSAAVSTAGFEHLQGYSGQEHKFTIQRGETPSAGAVWYFPTASSCFNKLILPPYETQLGRDKRQSDLCCDARQPDCLRRIRGGGVIVRGWQGGLFDARAHFLLLHGGLEACGGGAIILILASNSNENAPRMQPIEWLRRRVIFGTFFSRNPEFRPSSHLWVCSNILFSSFSTLFLWKSRVLIGPGAQTQQLHSRVNAGTERPGIRRGTARPWAGGGRVGEGGRGN